MAARTPATEAAPDLSAITARLDRLERIVALTARLQARIAVHRLAPRPGDLVNVLVQQMNVATHDDIRELREFLEQHGGL
jgi:hypothetical protein